MTPIVALAAVFFLAPAVGDEHAKPPHWTYEGAHGPSHWSELDNAYRACAAGTHQSPIDIHGEVAAALPALEFRSFPLEAHLVHASADGRLAVVAVMVAEGAPSETIGALWTHWPSEPEKELRPAGVVLDAARLLPRDRGYYTFEGSLTTPPCTEGVTWFVLKSPIAASREQIAEFAARYPHNARPLQQGHGRVIKMTR